MCVGVDNGLAGMKLSGSRNICGYRRVINLSSRNSVINPIISFDE
jgi:hypothetical protein